jgi:hypothetical protein
MEATEAMNDLRGRSEDKFTLSAEKTASVKVRGFSPDEPFPI